MNIYLMLKLSFFGWLLMVLNVNMFEQFHDSKNTSNDFFSEIKKI